ncbi:hypothetical protein [Oxynema sp. CENA135]|nr:hypothetical protein [Oxynema sp. CENA135]
MPNFRCEQGTSGTENGGVGDGEAIAEVGGDGEELKPIFGY